MRSLILNIGTSCFVRCDGCYNFFASSLKDKSSVNFDDIVNLVKLFKDNGGEKLTIGGGDPLSRPDLPMLLKEIKMLGIKVNLDTVGTAFLQEADTIFFGKLSIPKLNPNEILENVDRISVPLDGSNNEICARFRKGRKELFTEQIQIINLLNHSHKLGVNTVVHKGNIDDLVNILKILENNQVQFWQLFQFMPIGPLGFKNREEFEITTALFQETIDQLNAFKKEHNYQIVMEAKSTSDRKDNYLIMDDSGTLWIPKSENERGIVGNSKTSLEHLSSILNDA